MRGVRGRAVARLGIPVCVVEVAQVIVPQPDALLDQVGLGIVQLALQRRQALVRGRICLSHPLPATRPHDLATNLPSSQA